jgi:serine/threonine-protein kinase RsbW
MTHQQTPSPLTGSALALTVKNRLAELERVGAALDAYAADHGLTAPTTFKVKLALDEIITNIIAYAYSDGAEHEIDVRVSLEPGRLVLQVEDDGCPFNPLEAPAPPLAGLLAARPIGGLGIHLVRQAVDGLAYRRHGGRNRLTMQKSIADPESASTE